MKNLYLCCLIACSLVVLAAEESMHQMHDHEGHLHDTMIDGSLLKVNPVRFDNFVSKLTEAQVAIISVNGMVCDFCARGIAKTFKKDRAVTKVDVDLAGGKVFVAYKINAKIDFEDIKEKILSNGQNATNLQVIKI